MSEDMDVEDEEREKSRSAFPTSFRTDREEVEEDLVEELVVLEFPKLKDVCDVRHLHGFRVQVGDDPNSLRIEMGDFVFEATAKEPIGSIVLFEKDYERRTCHYVGTSTETYSFDRFIPDPQDRLGKRWIGTLEAPPPSATLDPVPQQSVHSSENTPVTGPHSSSSSTMAPSPSSPSQPKDAQSTRRGSAVFI